MNIGIVGGGAAGLAAAYELLRNGHSATVFERAPFLGGQASTFLVQGVPLERGYHHLFTSDRDMIWLIEELGLSEELAWLPSRAGLFHQKQIWKFTTPVDLLKFRPLTFIDRIRLGLITLYLQRIRKWQRFEGVTAAKWLRSRVGRRAYEAVWEPLLRGKFGQYYDRVGMVWFWGKIALRFASRGKGMVQEKLGYPMVGFGKIFDSLGDRIRDLGGSVHTNASVQKVLIDDRESFQGLEVRYRTGEIKVENFDAVIITTPSHIVPKLIPELPQSYSENLSNTTYLAAVLLILELTNPLSSIYWLNIADRDIPFVGVIEQTNFVPANRYGGSHVVYLTNYLGSDNPLYHASHDELLKAYLPHLQKINPEFKESWILKSHYHREDAAQPVVEPGYNQKIPSHRTPIQGIYLANTTQIYPEDRGTNYSVRLGRKVSRMVLLDNGSSFTDELPESVIHDSITSSFS